MPKNPIFCAIDTKEVHHAKQLCQQISPYIGGVKLGLEFFVANGVEGVKEVVKGLDLPLFLDLKFHDIPNTVAQAVRSSIKELDISILTLHITGGKNMIQQALEAAHDESSKLGKTPPLIAGVTILTSMDQQDLKDTGISHTVEEQVSELARFAKKSGLEGVVCSAMELSSIKEQCGKEFKTIVPGIRPEGSSCDDQNRIMTPKQALNLGADYLVIGRPITKSNNPAEAAKSIAYDCKT